MVSAVMPNAAAWMELAKNPQRYPDLPEGQRERLMPLGERIIALVGPLARVTSRDGLEYVLQNTIVPWTRIAIELLDILSAQNLTELLREASEETETLARKKIDALGEDSLEQFLGAYRSLRALTEWALARDAEGGIGAERARLMAQIVGPWVLRASILLSAVTLVLGEAIPDWRIEAIPVLCAAADEYMTQVEDAFESLILTPIREEELVGYRATG